jgi:hypothetical protein
VPAVQVLSSVLYLSAHGGPTIVLEQRADDRLAACAFAVTPRENMLLCFPGAYLHGVLPGMGPCWCHLLRAWIDHIIPVSQCRQGSLSCQNLQVPKLSESNLPVFVQRQE